MTYSTRGKKTKVINHAIANGPLGIHSYSFNNHSNIRSL